MKIRADITKKKERLALYYKREGEMLSGGVQSYGIGTKNLARYNTDLATIRKAIEELEGDINELESELRGGSRRKAVGAIPRDV